jgi:hypothetical protein
MPLLEGHAQLCLIGEKGRAPFGRVRTFWKGMPLLEGHAQLCLFDRKGRTPVGQGAPKEEWHSLELNLLIQHTVSTWMQLQYIPVLSSSETWKTVGSLSVAAAIEAVVKRALYISEMSQTCDILYT